MSSQSIIQKYNLPVSVTVNVVEDDDGSYLATFPDLPGCMTVADSTIELIANITDALLTYFAVPRDEAQQANIAYLPKIEEHQPVEDLQEKHMYMLVSQRTYGTSSRLRTS